MAHTCVHSLHPQPSNTVCHCPAESLPEGAGQQGSIGPEVKGEGRDRPQSLAGERGGRAATGMDGREGAHATQIDTSGRHFQQPVSAVHRTFRMKKYLRLRSKHPGKTPRETKLLAVFTKDLCFRNFPKDSKRFVKFWNHLVHFNILHYRVGGHKYPITDKKSCLKWHYWRETICKNYIIERPIAETFRNFRNVSKSFGNYNPSRKRPFITNEICGWLIQQIVITHGPRVPRVMIITESKSQQLPTSVD